MTSQASPTPDAGSASTGSPQRKEFPRWAIISIAAGVLLLIIVLVVAFFNFGQPSASPSAGSSPTMKMRLSQDLSPVSDLASVSGVRFHDGRLQCDDNSASLALTKDGKVKSPKGDTVKAKWTSDSVIITISGSPIQDTYKSVIFDGKNTVIAAIASVRSDATDVTLTGNFAKEFKDSAPAKSVRLCIGK